jgi:hypothetical protein
MSSLDGCGNKKQPPFPKAALVQSFAARFYSVAVGRVGLAWLAAVSTIVRAFL